MPASPYGWRKFIQRGTRSDDFLHKCLRSECFCFEVSFFSFFFFSCENCSYFFVSLKDLHPYLQCKISQFRRNRDIPKYYKYINKKNSGQVFYLKFKFNENFCNKWFYIKIPLYFVFLL